MHGKRRRVGGGGIFKGGILKGVGFSDFKSGLRSAMTGTSCGEEGRMPVFKALPSKLGR